ncbi:MAG: pyruvate kinase [Ignavibacteriae bacterium HGW-Ignavibacteriae-4]|jgi:pyruvate kinase|nr:MAG: pyruvate kinase [Ignavibacteriae bacterium HGW-Ignavibacteriae-4]
MTNDLFPRKTKILCTIGPAATGTENLTRLIYAGMDAARLNFSHGSHEVHKKTIKHIRAASNIAGRNIPILMDLQGPKIRIGNMKGGGVELLDKQEFTITTKQLKEGNEKIVSTEYTELKNEVRPGHTILLDDGYISLKVIDVKGPEIKTQVIKGGILKSKKGIVVPGASSNAPSLSEKDLEDLKFGLDNGVDAVALSFVRSKIDIMELKTAMKIFKREVPIIAKIERVEAYENIDEIIQEATGIMVARGDLGLEMAAERVPLIQKEIINRCNYYGKPVITATQMLESMIENPRPTRAEASDVANAVMDGSDCLMLSAESSVGKYPYEAVGYMSRIIKNIEEKYPFGSEKYKSSFNDGDISDALGHAATMIADQINAAAIVSLTSSAYTAKNVANYRPRVPIIAFTDIESVARRLSFIWGVIPKFVDTPIKAEDVIATFREELLEEFEFIKEGDYVVYVAGLSKDKPNYQNMIRVFKF